MKVLRPRESNRADINMLIAYLSKFPIGSVVSYAEINENVGVDVRERRYVLKSSLTALLSQQSVWGTIHNFGIKRLSPTEVIASTDGVLRRVQTMTQQHVVKLAAVENSEMDDAQRQSLAIKATVLAGVHCATNRVIVNAIGCNLPSSLLDGLSNGK